MTATYSALYSDSYQEHHHVPAVTATVHTPDGTHVADLPRLVAWAWSDQLTPLGRGSVTLDATDPRATPATLATGNVVCLRLDGTPAAGFIIEQEPDRTLVGTGPRTVTVQGPDAIALLATAGIYPERGLGRHEPQRRPLNWASRDWQQWVGAPTWGSPTPHGTLGSPDNPEWEKIADVPAALSGVSLQWAGPTLGGGAPAYIYSPMDSWHRLTVNLAADTEVQVWVTADDELLAVWDGQEMIRTEGTQQWRRLHKSRTFVAAAGDHTWALRGRNLSRPGGTHAPASAAMIAAAVVTLDGDGQPDTILAKTGDANWLAIGDIPPPGMTPGRSMSVLVAEAQARGCLPGLTLDFDGEEATPRPGEALGELWLDDVAETVDCTRTLLDVVTALAASSVDVTLDLVADGRDVVPTLRMWGRARRLEDLSTGDAPVSLRRDIATMTAQGTHAVVNAVRLDTPEGWGEVVDSASVAEHGRREGALRAGEHEDPDAADALADAELDDTAGDGPVATVTLADSARTRPGQACRVGDLVLAPDRTDATTDAAWRILTVACDGNADDPAPHWTLEIGPAP